MILLLGCLTAGCQPPLRTTDWSEYDGPGAEHFQREEVSFPHVHDPIEPINRGISIFNHGVLTLLAQPVNIVYRLVTPNFLETGISNALDNLRYPRRFVGNLLQAKWSGLASETGRFLTNTTLGIGGLVEVAEPWFGLEPSDEDVGQAFGRWGWRNSTYFYLPFLGPTTVRDSLGFIGDSAANPLTYVRWAATIQSATEAMILYPSYRKFITANFDPYELGRLLYVLDRELSIDDPIPANSDDNSGQSQTLALVHLSPDGDFGDQGSHREVEVLDDRNALPYTC